MNWNTKIGEITNKFMSSTSLEVGKQREEAIKLAEMIQNEIDQGGGQVSSIGCYTDFGEWKINDQEFMMFLHHQYKLETLYEHPDMLITHYFIINLTKWIKEQLVSYSDRLGGESV